MQRLRRLAEGFAVVVMTGPRQSGRTTPARGAGHRLGGRLWPVEMKTAS